MDKDKLNAICADIDDGMKSFGKNREWDFAASSNHPEQTDERTGGQKSEKVSKIERLLADLDKIKEK